MYQKRTKRIFNIILITCISIVMLLSNITFSAVIKERYFKVIRKEENNGQILEYGLRKVDTNEKTIRDIFELDGSGEDAQPIEERPSVYCFRAGTGFPVRNRIEVYNIEYNMKTEREAIEQHNELTYQFVNREYDKALALASIIYVPGRSTEEYKQKLIKEVNEKYNVGEVTYQITDSDIYAVNQAVIWHYTNPEDNRFENYNEENWLTCTTNNEDYIYLSEYNKETKEGEERAKQANALYKYLIDTVESQVLSGEEVNDTCKIETTEDQVSVRKQPNTSAEVITTLNKDTEVTRIVKNIAYVNGEEWDKIRLEDGTEAFIENKNLKIVTTNKKYKVVTFTPGGTVLLRDAPNGQKICSITDQDEVTLLEKSVETANGLVWDKIKLSDETEGYVASQYIEPLDEYNSDIYRAVTAHGVNGINLRDGANTSSSIITSIPNGSIITKLEKRVASANSYIWDKVKLSDGTEGYIATQYIQEIHDTKEYDINKVINEPLTIEANETTNYALENGNYILGPINVTKNNDIICDVDITISNKENKIENYTILDSAKETVEKNQLLEGGEFYISVPTNGIEDIKVDVNLNYEATEMSLIASTKDDTVQLLGDIYKQTSTKTKEMNINMFDLSLRKYITQVGDKKINDREPDIETEALETGTTATYNHKKDPVEVSTGDEIIYDITIYNEGEQVGRATKITDQLPTGIEFVEVLTDNYEVENYNTETNTLILKEKSINNLDAYTGDKLASETVRIKCKVTEEPSEEKEKILTNIAWISESINDEGTVLDRDSEPSVYPEFNKDNMEEYKGNEANNDVGLEEDNYFFKGQQDDDDFEKLVIAKKVIEAPPSEEPPTEEPPTQAPSTQKPTVQEPATQQKLLSYSTLPYAGPKYILPIIAVLIPYIIYSYIRYRKIRKI